MTIHIDHSQDGNSLFENVYITGLLDYDFSGDDLEVNKLKIKDSITAESDVTISNNLIVRKI